MPLLLLNTRFLELIVSLMQYFLRLCHFYYWLVLSIIIIIQLIIHPFISLFLHLFSKFPFLCPKIANSDLQDCQFHYQLHPKLTTSLWYLLPIFSNLLFISSVSKFLNQPNSILWFSSQRFSQVLYFFKSHPKYLLFIPLLS